MTDLPAWSQSPELVEMYRRMRRRPEDLYPSEARFLPELARHHASVLDAGCAAGGFAEIWRHYNPALSYLGVDLSAAMIEAARQLHPAESFRQADLAAGLDWPDRHVDLVAALGWLHWEPRWEAALRELWRLAARTLFFDVRLDPLRAQTGQQQLAEGPVTPYLVLAWPAFRTFLESLAPGGLRAFGYYGPPRDVSGIGGPVCFATFVLSRRPGPTELELPF